MTDTYPLPAHGGPGGSSSRGSGGGLSLVHSHGGRVVAIAKGDACECHPHLKPQAVEPCMLSVHPHHPHPAHHPHYWLWNGQRYDHIVPAPPAGGFSASIVVPPHLLPANWPKMVKISVGGNAPRPPAPPRQYAGRVHLIPAVAHPGMQAKLAAAKFSHKPVHEASMHQHFVPGHWAWTGKKWVYKEPHYNLTSGVQEGESVHDVAAAPLAAFGPRPVHVAQREFWPLHDGRMVTAYGHPPAGADARIVVPAHVTRHLAANPADDALVKKSSGQIQAAGGLAAYLAAHPREQARRDLMQQIAGETAGGLNRDLARGARERAKLLGF